MLKILLVFAAIASAAQVLAAERQTRSTLVYASQAGAALDSDLMKGGGTDDTAILQRLLDRAKDGGAVHLIVDGPALIRGLDLYSHTTLECTAGGGFYLAENSPRAILRNAHRSREAVKDEHITIRGCFINGNRRNQEIVGPAGSPYRSGQDAEGAFRSGLQFFGVHYLTVEGVTLWDILAWGSWVANAKFIHVSNVIVERPVPPFPEGADPAGIRAWLEQNAFGSGGKVKGNGNDDGLHFNGPIQYLTIDNVKVRTWDDGISLAANDYGVDDMTVNNELGPHVGQGPITDVVIKNVVFMDAHHAIRLLSGDQRLDRVVIDNVTGTIRERMAVISPFMHPSGGNFGSITFSNINVNLGKFPAWTQLFPENSSTGKYLKDYYDALAAGKRPEFDVGEEAEIPLFALNGRMENLNLQNIVVSVADRDRPLIRVGYHSAIELLNVKMSIRDPAAQAVPLRLMGKIERLNFALDWPGQEPIQHKGGSIGTLRWIGAKYPAASSATPQKTK